MLHHRPGRVGILLMILDEASALHKQTARAAGRIEDAPVERLITSTINLTMTAGVKNSPPFCPSLIANLPRKYS